MNDIEKKLETMKAEFLEKLEELQKEAEEQKKQEEWKLWKPEAEEGYFYIGNTLEAGKYFNGGDPIDDRLITVGNCFRTKKRANKSQRKCGCCYGWNNCIIYSARIMCRTGKMAD